MRDQFDIEVELREPGSSNVAKRLRASGKLPAVLYGGDSGARTIVVDPKTVIEILTSEGGQNTILKLKVGDGREQTALIHDYDVDPVTQRLLHADFKRIRMDVAVEVDVPVHLIGDPRGVKIEHGILDQVTREVAVRCLPGDIPDSFDMDVSELDIGDALHVFDIEVPEGVEILVELDTTLATVAPPTAEIEVEEEDDDLISLEDGPELVGAEDEEIVEDTE